MSAITLLFQVRVSPYTLYTFFKATLCSRCGRLPNPLSDSYSCYAFEPAAALLRRTRALFKVTERIQNDLRASVLPQL